RRDRAGAALRAGPAHPPALGAAPWPLAARIGLAERGDRELLPAAAARALGARRPWPIPRCDAGPEPGAVRAARASRLPRRVPLVDRDQARGRPRRSRALRRRGPRRRGDARAPLGPVLPAHAGRLLLAARHERGGPLSAARGGGRDRDRDLRGHPRLPPTA